jgi:hypothetical protein
MKKIITLALLAVAIFTTQGCFEPTTNIGVETARTKCSQKINNAIERVRDPESSQIRITLELKQFRPHVKAILTLLENQAEIVMLTFQADSPADSIATFNVSVPDNHLNFVPEIIIHY